MQDFTQFQPMDFSPWSKSNLGGNEGDITNEDIAQLRQKRAASAAAAPNASAGDYSAGAGDDQSQGGYDDGGVDGQDAGQAPASAFDAVAPQQGGPTARNNPNVFTPGVGAGVNQAALPPGGVNPNQSIFGRIHDKMQNIFAGTGTAPAGSEYTGLSPQEIQALKPGLIESVRSQDTGGPSGQQLWEQRIMQAAAMRQAANVKVKRDQLFAQNPPPGPGATPEQLDAWARSVTPGLMAIGDYNGVKQLGVLLKQKPTGKGDPYINAQGETRYFDTTAGSTVPAGWAKVKTGGGNDNSHLFVNPKDLHQQEWVQPGDNAKLEELAKKGFVESTTAREQDVQANTGERFGITNNRQIGQEFNSSPVISVMLKRAQDYTDFKTTLDEAKHANPTAYKGLITQMAPLVDPGVQMRLGTLQFINKLDPSLLGQARTVYQRLVDGSYPQDQLANLEKLVDRLHNVEARYYDSLREDTLRGSPGAAIHIKPTDLIYGSGWRPTDDSTLPNRKQSDAEFFKSLGVTPVRKP